MSSKPYIIAHRGGRKHAPENTIASLNNGIKLQADAIEFDLHITKDHIPVLLHDESVYRTTLDPQKRLIQDMTLPEVKALDAGSWFGSSFAGEQIPTFEETIQAMPKTIPMFIEIKQIDVRLVYTITNLIEQYDIINRVKILSFHKEIIDEIKRLNPNIHTMFLLHKFKGDIQPYILDPMIDSFGLGLQLALTNKALIKTLRQANKEVFVYSVNHPLAIWILTRRGITGIITDQPGKTRKVINTIR